MRALSIQKPIFLLGEIVTQMKGSDEDTQNKFYQFVCQFSFFILKVTNSPDANELEIVQNITISKKEMFLLNGMKEQLLIRNCNALLRKSIWPCILMVLKLGLNIVALVILT